MPAAWGRESRFAVIAAVLRVFASCSNNDVDSESKREVVPVRISPARVENLDAPGDANAWALFDRNTRTGWAPSNDAPAGSAHVRVALGKLTAITHLKIFGASPYVLDVHTGKGAAITGLEHVRLDRLGAGWNELRLPDSVATDELVLELARADDGDASAPAPVGEIELWGADRPAAVLDASTIGALTAGSGPRPAAPPGVDVLAATDPAAIDLAPSAEPGGQVCGKIRFSVTRSPASYRRAWLAYAADGAFRPFVLTRSLNAAPMRRGQWFTASTGSAPFVDPVDPETLVLGDNHYDLCLPNDAVSHVAVHDAFFVGELDQGSNDAVSIARGPIDGMATEATSELLDPDNAAPVTVRTGERLVVAMSRWASPDAVLLRGATGTWAVDCLDDGGHAREIEPSDVASSTSRTLISLADGANELACTAIALRPTGGATASLSSVTVIGSGARTRIDWPTITLASPAEHFGQVAWVDGWASAPSSMGGAVTVKVQTTDMGTTSGAFGTLVSRTGDADKPWPVNVTAHFADGSQLTRTFVLDRAGSLAPKPGGAISEAENAARYGAPGQSSTVTVRSTVRSAAQATTDVTSIRVGTDAGVDIPGGAVSGTLDVTVKHLTPDSLPPLDPGLINVTAPDAHGFEFLPHGQKFLRPVDVVLPFDPALLPPGYVSDDVQTYYFDTDAQHWRRLARAQVDDLKHIIHSASDHFTTMINAVVVSPEHPELRQFNPNALSGIQAADPGAGIQLIAPPTPSSRGDAALGYSFDLPPGRHGLTPALGLSYNSSRGNGWVGVGWDLPISAIAVDTRFGAARYDCDLETETYGLDGEQLTPIAHRGPEKKRTDETTVLGGETVKIFHARVEGGFRQIIRHGASTKTYWWEVIDKAGTRSFFGGTPESGGPIAQATLTSNAGDVFEWALVEVRDLHNNAIRYEHERVASAGFTAGAVPGSALYPRAIRYTFEAGAQRAPYDVAFLREGRPDAQIDGRGGFKHATAERLRRIEVHFQDQLVRAWELSYTEGAFHKSLVESIQAFGASNTPFPGGAHHFEYFDEIRESPTADSPFRGFTATSSWSVGDDHIRTLGIPGVARGLLGNGEASMLGGSDGFSTGIHSYIGFNPLVPDKQNSFGGKVGSNTSSADAKLAFIDINGDGLPDKVFVSNGSVVYRLNQSGPVGGTRFSDTVFPVAGLSSLGGRGASMTSFGFEAYPGAASVIFNTSETFTHEDSYFADVNGDGLPDFVTPGTVFFNTPTATGPTFVPNDSGATPLPIVTGAVNPDGLVPDFGASTAQNAQRFPLVDAVRRWLAPYDGTVQITGAARLRTGSPQGDGVRVAIQLDGAELWSATIAAGDTTPKPPENVASVPVKAGDRLYFRTSALDDARDHIVDWDPVIEYTGTPALADPNLLSERRFQASGDFVLAGRDGMVTNVPFDGVIKLAGAVTKARTTDSVALEVTQSPAGSSQTSDPVFTLARDAASTDPFVVDQSLQVKAGDRLEVHFRIDSPIDLTAIGFPRASILHWQYVSATSKDGAPITVVDQNGTPIQISAPVDLDTYGMRVPMIEQPAFVAPQAGTLRVFASVTEAPAAHVDFTVKTPGTLIAKRAFSTSGTAEVDVVVAQGDTLYFDFSTRAQGQALGSIMTSVETTFDPQATGGTSAPRLLHFAGPVDRCSHPYRGWSYAGLNATKVPPGTPIPDDAFCHETSSFDKDTTVPQPGDLDGVKAQGQQLSDETLTFPLIPFPAGRACPNPTQSCDLPQVPLWGGLDGELYLLPGSFSASREGPSDLTTPTGSTVVHGATVSRIGHTTQIGESAGLNAGGISGSISNSNGSTNGVVDYLDMNGDGFPDVVGQGAIQYTTSHGTLGSSLACGPITTIDTLRSSTTSAQSIGIGGTVAQQFGNAKGRAATTGESPANGARNGTQMVSIGLNLSGNVGDAGSDVDLLDINGDGLPDRVFQSGGTLFVQLNVGYAFLDAEPFASAVINAGNSVEASVGATLGFNDGIYGFAGGASASRGESATHALGPFQSAGATLADVNGDGLLDQVFPSTGGSIEVGINTGAGFAPPVPWQGVPINDITQSATLSVGGGAYFTIGIPLCVATCWLIINPGADFSASMDRQEIALRDVDGDGFPDFLSSTGSDELFVGTNLTGRTNLLRKVTRPMGATIDLDYTRAGNTFEQPHSQFVLSRVTTFDGVPGDWSPLDPGADFQLMTYAYDGGFYDRREREFYGYARVVSTAHDTRGLMGAVPDDFDKPYARTTRTYRNDSFFTKGLLSSEVVEGLDTGTPQTFARTDNQYALRDVGTQQVLTTPAAVAATLSPVFPELRTTLRHRSEGDASASVQTEMDQTYDADGNVIQITDTGDVGTADDYTATITYTGHGGANAGCAAHHIIGLADSITVRSADGTVLRHRESGFDCATADQLELRQATEGQASAVSDFQYASNGNLTAVAGPANLRGQRYTLNLAYDAPTQSHVISVTDSFGQISTSDYDFRFGTITRDTDDNGNSITSSYDDFARLSTVVGPFEAGTGLTTIQFEYHPEQSVPYARTAHVDVFRSTADPIETVLFTDGLKRVLQTKKDATVFQGKTASPADVMTVSGCVAFDQVGRAFETHFPTTEPKSTAVNLVFDRSCDLKAPPTTIAFDVLGRPLVATLSDGTATHMAYTLGADRHGQNRFATTVVDALGTRSVTYRDLKDRILAVQQFNAARGEVIWTEYGYDAVDQLLTVLDDHGNLTRSTYDLAGRMRLLDSPDAGQVETVYDAASNVTRKITSNLRASSQAITYDYDFTRLTAIHYPSFPGNDVTYQYGSPAQLGQPGNLVGRIVNVTDASGSEVRAYDKLGELIEETKTIASATQGNCDNCPEVWTTHYVYDTWGRLQQMTYPDGEVLTYAYDSGGLVRSATGVKLGSTTPYVQRLEYDEFGQRAFLSVGNGAETTYAYNPLNRRLARLTAGDFQDLHYSYDLVGNITALSNQVPIPTPNSFGGPVDQTFAYDGLYRLTQATGEWRFNSNKRQDYALSLAYDTIHNITRKTQSDDVTTPGGSKVPQKQTTYDFAYAYAGHGPHQSTTIGDHAFSYDANGNQTGWDDLTSGKRRTIVWDEENRVQQISDNGQTTAFVYDDSGQRVIKRGKQGETAYINQFWTVRNRSVGTKHIFVGDTRIASKVVPGDAHVNPHSTDPFTSVLGQWWQQRSAQGMQSGSTVKNPHFAGNRMPDILPEDNFVYFYHPDHLGSTSFATAATGDLFEHLEYFPFGETWVSEQTNTQRLPNLFTSKELDEETQLYYFGARYYDPRTSVWQSADPILDRYLNGELSGGVYSPANLALYTHTWNNPLVLRDPDGRSTIAEWFAEPVAYAIAIGGLVVLTYQATKPARDATSRYISYKYNAISDYLSNVYHSKAADSPQGTKGSEAAPKPTEGETPDTEKTEEQTDAPSKVMGNSKQSTKPQHGYEIDDTKTGEVAKTGVSGGERSEDGGSVRAEKQAKRWNKEAGEADRYVPRVVKEIPEGRGSRQKILDWERENASRLREEGNLSDKTKHVRPRRGKTRMRFGGATATHSGHVVLHQDH
jgi:RHS repeat-associated protein